MSKNPSEIRSDVLKLATEYMQFEYLNNLEYVERMRSNGGMTSKEISELIKPYTFEDVMKKTTEMYKFVQKTL